MSATIERTCRVIRPGGSYLGKQGFTYVEGISAESVGATGLCMVLLTVPPGGRASAHKHEHHETAIYILAGEAETWFGERLEQHVVVRAGELFYIPADLPHLAVNRGSEPLVAVIARTDPNEQESVVLLPELEGLVPR
ncbi:cupin domain-containing protein [Kaistia granuli]|uniref:cupin domain-containing protein n=1 Tax=Kaistia granuli TaxID=363259 RepID=UPI0003751A63|nr:cupin domain-containing protein [Kaistia granuli]